MFQDQVGGLEVDPDHTGKFLPATLARGTCVINVRPYPFLLPVSPRERYTDIGCEIQVADLLQRLSNNRLKSTRHRVTPPQLIEEQKRTLGPEDYLPARYSTAFFVHPAPSHTVAPILLPGDPASESEPVNVRSGERVSQGGITRRLICRTRRFKRRGRRLTARPKLYRSVLCNDTIDV